jgi:septum formation protein
MRVILGSQSPRRKEILSYFSIPFVQIPSSFDEESVSFTGDPAHYALSLSVEKAKSLSKQYPDDVIITADTVVFFNEEVYNKPKDLLEACGMLKQFSGKWQQVFTAHTVQKGKEVYSGWEETKILFNSLTDEEIQLYQRSCPSLDKAGGYSIQGAGSLLVSKIDGCYYNVMGLSINVLKELLKKCGVDLWTHLYQK